jgi:hypothetical protein
MTGTPQFSAPILPDRVRQALAEFDPATVARAESFLATSARPCVDFRSERVSAAPLRRGLFGRLLGRLIAAPQLPVLASKFAGRPYWIAADGAWPKACYFLMQINFAELPVGHLSELPARGLLAVDLLPPSLRKPFAHRVRYYPDPSEELAVDPGPVMSRGSYEAALRFAPGWSYPGGQAWEAAVGLTPKDGPWEIWYEWQSEAEPMPLGPACHRLLGHPAAGCYELSDLPRGSLSEFEMLLRIDFDNAASFDWGSNVVYVLIHRDDLRTGKLERAFLTAANY